MWYTINELYHTYITLVTRSFFLFDDPPPTDIYTLSLHDALPISLAMPLAFAATWDRTGNSRSVAAVPAHARKDRKSTRLNSSHPSISYAVFCLKKKNRMYFPEVYTLLTSNLSAFMSMSLYLQLTI